MTARPRPHLVASNDTPAPWPEQPSRASLPTYSVPPIPVSHYRVTEPGVDLYRSLEGQYDGHVQQTILDAERRLDRRYRARVWLAIFGLTFVLAICAVAFVAGRENATHVSGGVNG